MSRKDKDTPDTDRLIQELRAKVDERRDSGEYPAELEERLSEHFRRISSQRPAMPSFAQLIGRLDRLNEELSVERVRAPNTSKMPGGSLVHRVLGKAIARQLDPTFDHMHQFYAEVRTVLQEMTGILENLNDLRPEVTGHVDAIYDRLAGFERSTGSGTDASSAEIHHRLALLEAAEAGRQFTPSFSNDAFEAAFRGGRSELLDRYRDLAKQFIGLEPILDIGCGRGEFLELLGELGLAASGIEIDPLLAEECRQLGLNAVTGDGIAGLAAVPDNSLGGIVLIEVVEHLSQQQLVDLVGLTAEKLRPGGRVIIETVNPQSLYVFARSFYVDPTHMRPVHPAYLTFLFRELNFSGLEIDWRSEPPVEERLDPATAGNFGAENVERLNQLLFAPQEYALIATK